MWMKVVLFGSALLAIVYAVVVYYDGDRSTRLNVTPIETLIDKYRSIPIAKSRVVVIFDDTIDENTLKSLLDQSVRVSDIAVDTDLKEPYFAKFSRIVSVHPKGTAEVRERESDTIVIRPKNGRLYSYDYIERALAAKRELKLSLAGTLR